MKLFNVIVPPYKTSKGTILAAYGRDEETLRKNALANYNKFRAENGFAPMKRMPNGTKYEATAFQVN